jgi:hypothetical protein
MEAMSQLMFRSAALRAIGDPAGNIAGGSDNFTPEMKQFLLDKHNRGEAITGLGDLPGFQDQYGADAAHPWINFPSKPIPGKVQVAPAPAPAPAPKAGTPTPAPVQRRGSSAAGHGTAAQHKPKKKIAPLRGSGGQRQALLITGGSSSSGLG